MANVTKLINNTDKQAMINYARACVVLLCLFLFSLALQGVYRDVLVVEGGLVETATVIGYVLCALFIIYKRKLAQLKYFFFIIIFFMLRELDFHKRFTTMGIFKTRFFTSSVVPLHEKLIGGAAIGLLILVTLIIVFRYAKDFIAGLKKGSAVSYGVVLVFALLAASKSFDGFARKMKEFGIIVSKQAALFTDSFEEIAEMGVPVIIFLILCAYCKDPEV